jgi:hypothetical protein
MSGFFPEFKLLFWLLVFSVLQPRFRVLNTGLLSSICMHPYSSVNTKLRTVYIAFYEREVASITNSGVATTFSFSRSQQH